MFTKCVDLWHTLSDAEKQTWESAARPHHMTGYAWYISQCLRPNPGIYLPLQGGTMSGDIDMAKNRILKLPAPADAQEAVTKAYADAITGQISFMSWRRQSQWHFSFPQGSTGNIPIVDDTIYAVPFFSPSSLSIDGIGLWVTAGVAGNARLGIYEDDGDVYPGALFADCGLVDVTAAGAKSIVGLGLTFVANTLYWLACLSEATPDVKALVTDSFWSPIGANSPSPSLQRGTWQKAQAYGALPDPFPSGALTNAYTMPGMGVKIT